MDQGQKPFSVLYEVFETNADLEQVKVVYQGYDRDMAETKMFLLFRASGYGTDFMLLNSEDRGKIEVAFSAKTKQLRGECQG